MSRLPAVAVPLLLALVPGLVGCRSAAADGSAAEPAFQAAADTLGRELFTLVDRAVEYRTAQRGRPASSIGQLGIDSLTPGTVRRLTDGARDEVTVAFRRPDHAVASCRGDRQVLEDAGLQAGRFAVACMLAEGSERAFTVRAR